MVVGCGWVERSGWLLGLCWHGAPLLLFIPLFTVRTIAEAAAREGMTLLKNAVPASATKAALPLSLSALKVLL
jgi:hypothetical protein